MQGPRGAHAIAGLRIQVDGEAAIGYLAQSKVPVRTHQLRRLRARSAAAQSQGGCDAALFDERNGTACCGLVFRRRIAAGSRLALPALVLVDLLLQIVELLARQQADLLQRLQMRFGLGQLADHQVGLADIFVGAAMARIEL